MESLTQPLTIDGSILEGGGQIFRISLVLSYLLQREVNLINIRAGRKSGGLGNQHLTCLNALHNQFFRGAFDVSGNEKGSTEVQIRLKNGQMRLSDDFVKCLESETATVDCGTVGSINLILQCLIPVLVFQPYGSLNMKIYGGTMTSH